MERFRELFENRKGILQDLKEQTDKLIFGYLCTYVPEEILYAAEMLPIRIFPETEAITSEEKYLAPFLCPYIRAILDQALKGKYSYLDGFLQNHTCDGMTHLYAEWNKHVKPNYSYFLGQPYLKDSAAKEFYVKTLRTFTQWLEVLTIHPMTSRALLKAIQIYNEHRDLLRQLGLYRQADPPKLLGSEFFEIIRAGMVCPKEEINQLIEDFLGKLKNRQVDITPKIKILISGGEIEDLEILKLIEQCGAHIVADDLCIGSRYYWDQIDLDGKDPLKAIVDRYIEKVACPCRDINRKERFEHIIKMYKDAKAQGIIFIFQKSCGPHLGDYPYLAEQLSTREIPHLQLILEHDSTMISQLQNRIEAFIEMVGGRNNV